jgi:hypothetical protein
VTVTADTPVTRDPTANKAVVAAMTTVVGFVIQWLATGSFQLGAEGVTLLTGAVVTLLVYAVSNYKRLRDQVRR